MFFKRLLSKFTNKRQPKSYYEIVITEVKNGTISYRARCKESDKDFGFHYAQDKDKKQLIGLSQIVLDLTLVAL
jgi:hypothetical protein